MKSPFQKYPSCHQQMKDRWCSDGQKQQRNHPDTDLLWTGSCCNIGVTDYSQKVANMRKISLLRSLWAWLKLAVDLFKKCTCQTRQTFCFLVTLNTVMLEEQMWGKGELSITPIFSYVYKNVCYGVTRKYHLSQSFLISRANSLLWKKLSWSSQLTTLAPGAF